jgi:FdhE protein
MRQDAWLGRHPWLKGIAAYCDRVRAAASETAVARATVPDFEAYRGDFLEGVPLLQSGSMTIDLEPARRATAALAAKLAGSAPAGLSPEDPGLQRFLGWTATARFLRPVVDSFARWRDEERWMRRWCPTCGSLPAMAQLVGIDPGRMRFLVCGCCETRWRFERTACPFCESDARRLNVLAIEGEPALRLDSCESCRGYLKTWDGSGDEALHLADWTSLHLDVLARDRGLERRAASLFDLDLDRAGRAASP